jgi:hypothetical protein
MRFSHSYANTVNRFELVVAAAKAHSKELPKEAAADVAHLEKLEKEARDFRALQQQKKRELKELTDRIASVLKDGRAAAAKVVKVAEWTFGRDDARMGEFRPADGRVRSQPAPAEPEQPKPDPKPSP